MTSQVEIKRTGKRISPRKEIIETGRIRRGFERKLETQLGRFENKLARNAEKQYLSTGKYIPDNLSDQLNQIMVPHYRAVVLAFAKRAFTAYQNREPKRSFDDLVYTYLSTVGGRRITRLSDGYISRVMREIKRGQGAGESLPTIAKRLRESDLITSKLRAATIARTETHSASQWANHEQHRDMMPPNTVKQWVSVGDTRTRPSHAALNGTQVGMDEDFIVMTNGVPMKMQYAGDPQGGPANVINCRCQIIYVEPDDVVEGDDPSRTDKPQPVRVTREKIDLSPLPTVRGFGATVRAEAEKVLNNRPDPVIGNAIAKVLKENGENVTMVQNGNVGLCSYYYGSRRIKITANPFEESGAVQVHEWGHAIDRYLGLTEKGFLSGRDGNWLWTQGDEFTDAMIADRKILGVVVQGRATAKYKRELAEKYVPLYDKFFPKKVNKYGHERYDFSTNSRDGNFSDILDALFAGVPYQQHGVFGHGIKYYRGKGNVQAEVWANMADMYGTDMWPKVVEVAPNMARVFEEKMKDFIK